MESDTKVLLSNGTPDAMDSSSGLEMNAMGLTEPLHGDGYAAECARYDEVRRVASTGNGLKLDELLVQWREMGWLRDWRGEDGLTLYADAITDGFGDVVTVLLKYDIPLGDALLRAIDVESDHVSKDICQYLEDKEALREEVLQATSDNDDFHPSITPLILAAQRNNFSSVKLLLDLGGAITEPSISAGGDVSLTQAVSSLHVYRALSQPAYILATQTDIFGHAFELSAKVKSLSRTWEDFSKEYEKMADGIERFAADILGQSSSTEEILALFRYHNTDKYRHTDGKQHPLAKLFEAIKYQQKEFIAHPHSQKAIIVQFYRSLLDWNERGLFHQILLLLLVLLGYPFICLLYIFVPTERVVNFARLPYVMMMMKAGSGLTVLVFMIVITVLGKHAYPRTTETLHMLVMIWIVGLAWLHLKVLVKHGFEHYFSESANVHELLIMTLYLAVFVLQSLPSETGETAYNPPSLHDLISSNLDSLQERVNATVLDGIEGVINQALSGCKVSDPTDPLSNLFRDDTDGSFSHLRHLRASLGDDQYEPTVVASTLFGVAITVSVLRMTNLFLVSDSVGPLRISMGAMVSDIAKFLATFMFIWFAFAIGLFQNYYSAGQSATRTCMQEGNEGDSCRLLVGFSTFVASMTDLYWSLYGLTDISILMVPSKHSVAETFGTFIYQAYLIVAVLVLLNALIGMLSNTYNLTEEHADTEWKFHRATVWAVYLRPVGTLPPPFNLIPSMKSLYRVYSFCSGMRRRVVNRKEVYNQKELDDYKRVQKLVSTRYIQSNLSTESQNNESARPRDLQTLRNDIMAFNHLEKMGKSLDTTHNKTDNVHGKLSDLDPLSYRASELVSQSVALNENVGTLWDETGSLQQTQYKEMAEREMDAQQLRETIAQLRADAAELSNKYSKEIQHRDQLEAEMARAIQDLQRSNREVKDIVRGMEEEKALLKDDISRLQDVIVQSGKEADDLRKAVEAVQSELDDYKSGTAGEVYEQLAKHKDAFHKLRDANRRLKEAVDTLREEKAALSKTLEGIREGSPTHAEQPSSLKYAVAAHRVEMDKLSRHHAAELEVRSQKEARLDKKIRSLQAQLAEAERKTKGVAEELQSGVAQLREELENSRSSHSAEIEEVRRSNTELQDSNRELREERGGLEKIASKLEGEKTELAGLVRDLNREFSKLEASDGGVKADVLAESSHRSDDLLERIANILGETSAADERM